MTANTSPTATQLNGVKQDTVHWPAAAHRVINVDSDGDETVNLNLADSKKIEQTALLEEIVCELKKINKQLEIMTDDTVKEDDVKC